MDREALLRRRRELYRQRRERGKGSEIISKERVLQATCVSRITCPQLLSRMHSQARISMLLASVQYICYIWIRNDSVNYTKLKITEKQSLLIRLRESPQIFIVKCCKCLCRQFAIMELHTVFFFSPVKAIGLFCCLNSTIIYCYELILK